MCSRRSLRVDQNHCAGMTTLSDAQAQPEYIIVENVVGFEASRTAAVLQSTLHESGYAVQEFLLSPLQLGIPYSRPRYFCIARKVRLATLMRTCTPLASSFCILSYIPDHGNCVYQSIDRFEPSLCRCGLMAGGHSPSLTSQAAGRTRCPLSSWWLLLNAWEPLPWHHHPRHQQQQPVRQQPAQRHAVPHARVAAWHRRRAYSAAPFPLLPSETSSPLILLVRVDCQAMLGTSCIETTL